MGGGGSSFSFDLSKKTHIFHLKKNDDGIGTGIGSKKSGSFKNDDDHHSVSVSSPLAGLPELSHLGWGHWFTLRDLESATNKFSKDNVIGEGGYGIVYRGQLINGTIVAVKRLLNNLLLVYEYVNNGNLEQWLHGAMSHHGHLTWEGCMKILLGTAKGLAYLHDAIEPKVVHRDIKANNILIDDDFNAKISDFGLAKLLGAGKSHIVTRVMGTFGYVAPEYASSSFLNEKSDVYSFGVKNLVDWLKMMVGAKRSEEVVDLNLETRPSTSALKRALLTALRSSKAEGQTLIRASEVEDGANC
ncbi:Protein kinase superfamily protein [Perilla frutescens var. frutescens]|nr:Protein kinase superfamily protein [Perilla frutescens var. frutescens]